MKTNQALDNRGHRGRLRSDAYDVLAQYFVKFVQAYASRGIGITAVTPQNEPDQPTSYPGLNLPLLSQAAFVAGHLAPALAAAGLHPQIYVHDFKWLLSSRAQALASDPRVAGAIAGVAWHCYDGNPKVMSTLRRSAPRLDQIESECSSPIAPGPPAELMIASIRNWASAVLLWNLALDPRGGPVQPPNHGCGGCTGVVTIDERTHSVRYGRDYYQLGQLSSFVGVGARRIASNSFVSYNTPTRTHRVNYATAGIDDVAFKNPDGSKVLLAHNNASRARRFAVAWQGRFFAYTLACVIVRRMLADPQLILAAGGLLAAGVAASAVAARLGVPALVLFLGLGMAIGTDGLGWIDFADYSLARLVGTIALVLILFEGGLTTGFSKLRPVLKPSASLAVIGTVGTAAIAGLAASWLFDFSAAEGLLLGAILSPTDGAAVFALMRGVSLPRRLALTLEGEAGLNDPIAIMLVLVMIEVIRRPGYGVADAAWFLVREIAIGASLGIAVGMSAAVALRWLAWTPPGLSLVASFATAAIAFGGAGALHSSGFLAVYLAGLVLGSARLPARRALLPFHEGLAAVAEIGMFFALGLLVFPSQLGGVLVRGTLLALIVAFVARPAAAFLGTVRTGFSVRERILLGWAGLRGGVPVVLATFPVIDHIPRSLEFFNLVFFAVVVSTLIQGATVAPVARRLGLIRPA
jgi:cell volume regulation protein A